MLSAEKKLVTSGCSFLATQSIISKTADHNSKRYTSTTIRVWLFAFAMLALTQTLPETDALPAASNDRHSGSKQLAMPRHPRAVCSKRLIKRNDKNLRFCTPEKITEMFPEHAVPWYNPCSANAYNDSVDLEKSNIIVIPLQRQLRLMLNTKYGTCKNSDGSRTYWCHKRSNYTFFEYSRKTDKLCLRLEHKRLQVYVAGLSYLSRTNENDRRHNLNDILRNAKTLLCEMETYINKTACTKAPKPLSPREMCLRLNLHSIKNEDDTEVDVIFAKANFAKYLRGLNSTLASQRHPLTCGRSRPGRRTPASLIQLASSIHINGDSDETNRASKNSQSRNNGRKNQHRRFHAKPPLNVNKHPRQRPRIGKNN